MFRFFGVVLLCLALRGQDVPVNVVPGVATTLKRVPPGTGEAFGVSASAGQTLLVELNVDDVSAASEKDKLSVTYNGKPLSSSLGEDTSGRWMSVVPKTGKLRIIVDRPSKKPYTLRITLMDAHDPRIDPGVTPDQVVLDLSVTGSQGRLAREPFSPEVMGELGQFWPAHLALQDDHVEVRIMTLDGLKKTFWMNGDGAKRVAKLEAAVQSAAGSFVPKDLPGSMNDEAAMTFLTCKSRVEGPGIRAARWIAFYAQDETAPVNPLTYAVDALTKDGKYFVMIRASISHPAVPKNPQDLTGAKLQAFRARLAKQLAAATPDSFQPSLAKLDAMVQGFRVP